MNDILTLENLRQQRYDSIKANEQLAELAESSKYVRARFALAFGNPHRDSCADQILTAATLSRRWERWKTELEGKGYEPLDFAMMQSTRISDIMKEENYNLVCYNFGINTSYLSSAFNSKEIEQAKTKKLKNE